MAAATDAVKVYEDRAHEWRWVYVARNGLIMADSGEGYISMGDAVAAVRHVFASNVVIKMGSNDMMLRDDLRLVVVDDKDTGD